MEAVGGAMMRELIGRLAAVADGSAPCGVRGGKKEIREAAHDDSARAIIAEAKRWGGVAWTPTYGSG
jgi:hypothetical protein